MLQFLPLPIQRLPRPVPPLTLADSSVGSRTTVTARAALVLAATVFVIARLWTVVRFRLTFDEVYTIETTRRSLGGLLSYLAQYDEHPPLFYLLVKGWTTLGGLDYGWLGLLPAIIAAATLVPLLLLCRALKMSARDTACAVALMAVNAYLTGFAEELRPYGLMLFLTLSSLWLFVTAWNVAGEVQRWLVALVIVNVLLVGTHHYGWLVIGAEWIIVAYWRHPIARRFSVWTLATILLLAPWVALLAHAAQKRLASGQRAFFFIPTPTLRSVASFYGALSGSTDVPHTLGLSLLLSAIPLGICVWTMRRTQEADRTRAAIGALLMLATFPVLVAFAVSKLSVGTAVWGQRHLIIAAAPFFLLIAAGIGRISHPSLRRLATGVILTWATVTGWESQTTPYKVAAWDGLAEQLVRAEPDHVGPVRVYTTNENAALPLRFYLQRFSARQFQVVVVQQDTPRNRQIFNGSGPRPYWAVDLPVVLQADFGWPLCAHCWVAVTDSGDLEHLTDAGLAVGPGFSGVLVTRRWNRAIVSILPAWSTAH